MVEGNWDKKYVTFAKFAKNFSKNMQHMNTLLGLLLRPGEGPVLTWGPEA